MVFRVMTLLSHYSCKCMEGLRKTIKNFSQITWSLGHEMQYFHTSSGQLLPVQLQRLAIMIYSNM